MLYRRGSKKQSKSGTEMFRLRLLQGPSTHSSSFCICKVRIFSLQVGVRLGKAAVKDHFWFLSDLLGRKDKSSLVWTPGPGQSGIYRLYPMGQTGVASICLLKGLCQRQQSLQLHFQNFHHCPPTLKIDPSDSLEGIPELFCLQIFSLSRQQPLSPMESIAWKTCCRNGERWGARGGGGEQFDLSVTNLPDFHPRWRMVWYREVTWPQPLTPFLMAT